MAPPPSSPPRPPTGRRIISATTYGSGPRRSGLRPLTHSGSEENPQWSPDGKWIAFVSDRALSGEAAGDDGEPASETDKADRLWVISVSGGEALPLYREKLDVHAFAWSPDGSSLDYAVTTPLTHDQQEAQKTEWKDVIRWREQHRGDVLLKPARSACTCPRARSRTGQPRPPRTNQKAPNKKSEDKKDSETATTLPAGAQTISKSPISITEIAPSPDGHTVAFETGPVHKRIENPSDYEIFLAPAGGGEPRQLTHNEAVESLLRWSPDSRWLHFAVQAAAGSLEGKYRDVEGRLYRMDPRIRQNRASRRVLRRLPRLTSPCSPMAARLALGLERNRNAALSH